MLSTFSCNFAEARFFVDVSEIMAWALRSSRFSFTGGDFLYTLCQLLLILKTRRYHRPDSVLLQVYLLIIVLSFTFCCSFSARA